MKGGVLIYATDNKLVERWLETRTSNHPFAARLLMIVAAIEAAYHIRVFAVYVRTYHNTVADDFTRLELADCLLRYGMSLTPGPDWAQWFQLGWIRRALIWKNQEPTDNAVARRLAYSRAPPGPEVDIMSAIEISDGLANYSRACLLLGARVGIVSWSAT